MKNIGITVKNPDHKPYLVTGHQVYMIAGQNGLFPERGEHMPYEMWGVWAPPIKLLNGFWCKFDGKLLEQAEEFRQFPYAAAFSYKEYKCEIERFQFVPQEEAGFVVEWSVKNTDNVEKNHTLTLGLQSNLTPVWLAERAGIEDGKDYANFDKEREILFIEDSKNPWTLALGCSHTMKCEEQGVIPVKQRENSLTSYCEVTIPLKLCAKEKQTVRFTVGYSCDGKEEAIKSMIAIQDGADQLLLEKEEVYSGMERTARLSYPNEPQLESMYEWTKYINDWCIRDVKGIGKGLVAGYPEFPWWFGNDTNYIVPALLMQGEYEVCKETLRLIRKKSEEVNGNGRVVHEISSNGIVYYEGMTTETPQFADTVWMVYCWSGEREFLEEMYGFCAKGMEWIDSMTVHGLPLGYGISEIAGLDCFCCDTALLAIRGYEILGNMSAELGYVEKAARYYSKKEAMWKIFKDTFYLEEYGIYGDMVGTKEDIISRAETWKYTLKSFPITEEEKIMGESSCKKDKSPEDATEKVRLKERMEKVIETAQKLPAGKRKAYYLFGLGHSIITAEFGYLKGKEARDLLEAMCKQEEQEKVTIENMMPIGIARKIIALGNAKDPVGIIENIKAVAKGFGAVMPGATNEIYPGKGCFVQAWNSLATMWPYANSIFGIRPQAADKKIILDPCVCCDMDQMALDDIVIGNEKFSFHYKQQEGLNVITVKIPKDWTVMLGKNVEDIKLIVE